MNILAFDIETVPDLASGRRLFNLEGLSDRDTGEVMFNKRRQETDNATDFLRPHLHQVVAISVALKTADKFIVHSLGEPQSDEAELVRQFFGGLGKYSPTLVSWNGRGFDLPVLHYRALLHGVSARRYWEDGAEDSAFRWNNYLNRYHSRHTDLMDALAGYEFRAAAPLAEIAVMLGFPGKLGMAGSQVWERYLAGDLAAIRNYCDTDALNTYLIYLRYELMRGRRSGVEYEAECEQVKQALSEQSRPHLVEFLDAWNSAG